MTVKTRYVVWGGNGRRRLRDFANRPEAEEYAAKFEQECWSLGVPVPRSWITEESE